MCELLRDYPQPLQANAEMVSQRMLLQLPIHFPYLFIASPLIKQRGNLGTRTEDFPSFW
jgi:hypothetical protein